MLIHASKISFVKIKKKSNAIILKYYSIFLLNFHFFKGMYYYVYSYVYKIRNTYVCSYVSICLSVNRSFCVFFFIHLI